MLSYFLEPHCRENCENNLIVKPGTVDLCAELVRETCAWGKRGLDDQNVRQQGRWCQKLKLEMIKRVFPFNQTQLEGTQHFIME